MSEHPQYIEIYLRESYGKESRESMRRALGMSGAELGYHIARLGLNKKKLREGTKRSRKAPVAFNHSMPSKKKEQEKLEEDKARFFAAGGKITKVPGFTEVRRKS